jgi:hypothetical protein
MGPQPASSFGLDLEVSGSSCQFSHVVAWEVDRRERIETVGTMPHGVAILRDRVLHLALRYEVTLTPVSVGRRLQDSLRRGPRAGSRLALFESRSLENDRTQPRLGQRHLLN